MSCCIEPMYLDCVVYLYHSEKDAEGGVKFGGTGFLAGTVSPADPSRLYVYAVTNRHVVDGGATVIRLNRKDGTTEIIKRSRSDWHTDQDNDVAVTSVALRTEEHKFSNVDFGNFVTKETIATHPLKIGVGDDVFMIGRFITYDGRQRNQPTVRFGNVSMKDTAPLEHTSNRGGTQESFLVEMRSLSGYSGSPVFVTIPPLAKRPGTQVLSPQGFGPSLLGIDWGCPMWAEYVRDKQGKALTGQYEHWHVHSNSGFAAVVPAWFINEFLNKGALKEEREKMDERLR